MRDKTWLLALGAAAFVGLTVRFADAQTVSSSGDSQSAAAEVQQEFAPELNAGDTASQPAPQGWKLPQPDFLQKHGITVGGWVEQGITANALNPGDKYNGPNATNDRNAEYQLNQAWLYFDKSTKTDGCGWDLGGHVDVVYGTDWRFGSCTGLEDRMNSENDFYGWILPQFYGEVALNDLTVKAGHFATNTSLELIPAPLNFFYSHSLLICPYFDPVLVTGLQADYKLSDNWTAVSGFNRGGMQFESEASTLCYLGGAKWASDDKRANLSMMVQAGKETGFTGVHDRWNTITVYTLQLTERLKYGSQYTAGIEKNGSVIHAGEDASWYGTEQLFTYTLTEKWSFGLRYEWVRDNDGSRVAGIGNILGTDRAWNGKPGCAGAYNDLSVGLNWRPNANWVVRPEARWDWYDGVAGASGLPYDSYTKREQFTVACDLIVTF